MEIKQAVYKLEPILDNPRYEGFGLRSVRDFPDSVPVRRTTRKWKVIRLAKTWMPMEVIGRVRKFNDFPCVIGQPAFSQRAVEALRDLLEPNGELLPLASTLGAYYFFNVTAVAAVLDLKRSEIVWNDEPITASSVERYEFDPSRLKGLSIFRLPELPGDTYVTSAVALRAYEHGLRGMSFEKVWPLPPGVIWWQLAKARKRLQQQEGLRKGHWVKGNTVVLRLGLRDRRSRGSAAERKAIGKLMDELNRMLVNINSDAPAVGNLEGHDYSVPGECRLFLSCPDADTLVERLHGWLKSLAWPMGIVALKRYGEYVDPDAREEQVTL